MSEGQIAHEHKREDIMSEWKPRVIAVRGLQDDEDYKVGDECRDSLAWDEELGMSSEESIGGTCAVRIVDRYGDFDREASIAAAKNYSDRLVIIGGDSYTYGNDENEVIIPYAVVLEIIGGENE
jgi:hypothetical protein